MIDCTVLPGIVTTDYCPVSSIQPLPLLGEFFSSQFEGLSYLTSTLCTAVPELAPASIASDAVLPIKQVPDPFGPPSSLPGLLPLFLVPGFSGPPPGNGKDG